MQTLLTPGAWMVLVVAVPLVVLVVVAAASDMSLSRSDRREGIVASFSGLGITANHLILGTTKDAERIPLTGLAVRVTQTETVSGAEVVVTIRGAGTVIERREPLSYGTGGQAQIFAVMFNRMSRARGRSISVASAAA